MGAVSEKSETALSLSLLKTNPLQKLMTFARALSRFSGVHAEYLGWFRPVRRLNFLVTIDFPG